MKNRRRRGRRSTESDRTVSQLTLVDHPQHAPSKKLCVVFMRFGPLGQHPRLGGISEIPLGVSRGAPVSVSENCPCVVVLLDSVVGRAPPFPPPHYIGNSLESEHALYGACIGEKRCGGRSGAGTGGPGQPWGGCFRGG